MFVGQQITVDLFVFYDDGTPAATPGKPYQDKELLPRMSPMPLEGLPSPFREKGGNPGAMRSWEEDILRRDP